MWASHFPAPKGRTLHVIALQEKLSALILAGGSSRRMGRDKAWMELAGSPLVETVARRVLPLADELIFSTNNPERFASLLGRLPVQAQLAADQHPGLGPLAGISAGLSVARNDLVLVLAVDMPFARLELLSYMAGLASAYDAVVPRIPGPSLGEPRPEPLHALYRRTCLPPILAELEAGHRQVVSFLPRVRVRWVMPDEISPLDPAFDSFRNLNTPADWEALAGKPVP
jgi:molybdopterin-guanine dinucleotide biosynthesis protein A